MVSDRLKARRIELGLTQNDVAKKLNITYQTISKYERGVNNIDSVVLSKLADVLDCTTDFLLGKTDNPQNKTIENDGYSIEFHKNNYPYGLTPEQAEKLFDTLKKYRIDVESIVKDIQEGKTEI